MINEERRKVLEEEKKDIERQLEESKEANTDFGSDIDGGDEESHETEATNLKMSLEQTLKNRLSEIEKELSEE